MEDKKPKNDNSEETKPQILVNDYGETIDPTVVVEEHDRTVLLTENETIIIPKEQMIDVPPRNRERKVYAGMWGTTELVTVGVAMLALLTTILLFVLLVLPAKRELNNNLARRDELDKQLTTAQSRYGNITSTQGRVNEILRSVDDFETRYLSAETNGKNALYQQLNGLIAAYGLTNTTGPDYAPLEIEDPNRSQQNEGEKGRSKAISIYPGQYVTMTVDGSYQNLRRFIREIETSNQFIVISAIELEPSENTDKPADATRATQVSANNPPTTANPVGQNQPFPNYAQPTPPLQQSAVKADRGKTHGETVTLRLEMAAYFRRPNFQPQAASVEQP
jgi:hypothetical protein